VNDEIVYVLYDPIKERFWSIGAVGRIYMRYADFFLSEDAARKMRDSWWENKHFSQVIKVIIHAHAPGR
jgi:hypothetical protein